MEIEKAPSIKIEKSFFNCSALHKTENSPDGNSLTALMHLVQLVSNAIGPIRDRANDLMSDPTELDKLLASAAEAEQTLATVYDRIGFIKASYQFSP
jgi:tryptophanyl-tRNA synthetase